MKRKVVGYIVLVLGLAAILLSYPAVQNTIGIALPSDLTNSTLLITGAALIIIGALIVFKNKSQKITEVPIYHGKEVVGYRRLAK